jgi:hypothetical protein
LFSDSDVQQFLFVNRYQGVLWFNKESFEQLLWWLQFAAYIGLRCDPSIPSDAVSFALCQIETVLQSWEEAAYRCNYQVDKLLDAVESSEPATHTRTG